MKALVVGAAVVAAVVAVLVARTVPNVPTAIPASTPTAAAPSPAPVSTAVSRPTTAPTSVPPVSASPSPAALAARPTFTPTETVSAEIPWDAAARYLGQRTTVCGPVVDARYASQSRGAPTFLNLGRPYPDPTRFTVVIWGRNLKNFPPQPVAYYLGKVICVTGVVAEYQGGVEIEATNSKQIQER